MHVVYGLCVNTVTEQTRTEEKRPYTVIQILSDEKGLIHRIDGEIISSQKTTMQGQTVQAVKILSNGARYKKIDNLVDRNTERVWKKGKVSVIARPKVFRKNGKPVLVYEICDEQNNIERVVSDNLFLQKINDYQNREWPEGELQVAVRVKPWISESSSGINYIALEEQA